MKLTVAVCALVAFANARPGPSPQDLQLGASGAIADGQNLQFNKPGVHLIAEGPSAWLFSNGQAIQKRAKRSASKHLTLGASGAIGDGQNLQFTEPGVHLIAEGPSAWLFSNGQAIQKRSKRSVSEFGDIIGASGVIAGNQNLQFPPGVKPVAVGPSAILLSNGQAIQRTKRSTNEFGDVIGASGVIASGQNLQIPPGVKVVLVAPSAILLSNGQAIQRT